MRPGCVGFGRIFPTFTTSPDNNLIFFGEYYPLFADYFRRMEEIERDLTFDANTIGKLVLKLNGKGIQVKDDAGKKDKLTVRFPKTNLKAKTDLKVNDLF